jgi:putative ABC transport system ATP-binding protein
MLETFDLVKVYGKADAQLLALNNVSLKVSAGEFVAIMGPSGSGKSTFMNIIGCLDQPTEGRYQFAGVDVTGLTKNQLAVLRRHYIGFIFQGFNLLARTTALENVELPLIYRRLAPDVRRRLARQALQTVLLDQRLNHMANELSIGQQQRVAIARAIVTSPSLLLADEPTGNLDSRTSQEIMALLSALNREQGITIVMVTHDPQVAACAVRVVQFVDGSIQSDIKSKG